MIDFYLITGFLGAGKTTFLKQLVRALPQKRIRLVINEFGREGVDGALLHELGAVLAEINNGSIFCACRLDQFEKELDRIEADAPEVVIAEASGLSDPTNICRILDARPGICYRGSICLADATRLARVFSTARMCPRQIAVSSLVLLSKTDLATPAQCAEAERLIHAANPAAHIEHTVHGSFLPEWLSFLAPSPNAEAAIGPDITLQKAVITLSEDIPRATLEKLLALLAEDTYRIKGFVRTADGPLYADCTGPAVRLSAWSGEAGNRLVLLAGAGMPLRRAVKTAAQWYESYVTGWE